MVTGLLLTPLCTQCLHITFKYSTKLFSAVRIVTFIGLSVGMAHSVERYRK